MQIGISVDHIVDTRPDPVSVATWQTISDEVRAAEAVGFDSIAIPDSYLIPFPEGSAAFWESVSLAGALAATTSSIGLSHGMINVPYRPPALVARMAETLDEISGGRYTLGLGAGNMPEADYAALGVNADRRYSRFAEAIEIIHALLKDGQVDFEGEFWSARDAQQVVRGPRPDGPPIAVGAWGPKMMRLAARYADEWSGYVGAGSSVDAFRPMVEELERACEEIGRDPASLRRSIDVPVDPLDRYSSLRPDGSVDPIVGTPDQIAEQILAYGELGIDEFRCETAALMSTGVGTIEAMAEVVDLVHAS